MDFPPDNRPSPRGRAVATPDDVLGHYRIIRELGRGGQATVYLAEDTRLHRQIALKVLDAGPSTNARAIERFRREAAITSKLDHPGICPVHDIGQDRGVLYIAMRHVEGETLANRIQTERSASAPSIVVEIDDDGAASSPPSEELEESDAPSGPKKGAEITAILALFEQAARALHAAHEHGVIHRDIKPGNIMVTPAGDPVILDFGLAQEADGDDVSLTVTGEITGTPAYMSPEQINSRKVRLDRRTDVYSLGVALFESLTLRLPFHAPTRDRLYHAILSKGAPNASELNPAISRDLAVILETALEKERDRRYLTANDLAEDLRRVRTHEPIVAKPAGPLVRVARWAERNPALAVALVGLFVALAVGLTIALLLLGKSERERLAKEKALGDVTWERNEKEAALSDYDRLGDLARLQELTAEAEDLWPAAPVMVSPLVAWVDRATTLESRLSGHEDALARMRKSAEVRSADSRSTTSASADSRRAFRFGNPTDQFKHDSTAKLVTDLGAFVDPDPLRGLLSDIRRRLAFAESVERETIDRRETPWADAIRSIGDATVSPHYGGLVIKPQLGLIPIGKDPASGLWEFAHLQTAATDADPVPTVGADGRLVVSASMGLIFVLLPPGAFRMGAVKPDDDQAADAPNVDPEARVNEAPVILVTLDPFFISKYEMTQAQWHRVTRKNPSVVNGARDSRKTTGDARDPVAHVSWEDCDLWLGRLGLVLPTEAQWEYAARAGTTTPWWTGDDPDGVIRALNEGKAATTVGAFAPNPFGLHDVIGNVWEWCRDWLGSYDVAPRAGDGLRQPPESRVRVARGGSFFNKASSGRSAVRAWEAPGYRWDYIGVRPARPLDR